MIEPLVLATMLKERFPHMTYLAEAIECPYCHAAPGDSCSTRTGRSTDYPHTSRFDAFRAV